MEKIAKIVAEAYGIEYYTMFKKSRKRTLVAARQMTIFLSRMFYGLSLSELADFFGKDHATAIHSIKTVTNEIETNRAKKSEYIQLLRMIREAGITRTKPMKKKYCLRKPYEGKIT